MAGIPIYWHKYRSIYCVYHGVPIDYFTYVPGPVSQSRAESEYNKSCTEVISLLEIPIPGEPGNRIIPQRESGIQFPGTRIIPLRESRI